MDVIFSGEQYLNSKFSVQIEFWVNTVFRMEVMKNHFIYY